MDKLFIFSLGVFQFFDITAAKHAPFMRYFYGMVYIVVVFSILIKFPIIFKERKINKLIFFSLSGLLLSILFFVPIPMQTEKYIVYIMGDFIVYSFPFLLSIYIYIYPNVMKEKNLQILYILLLISAFFAPILGGTMWGGKYWWNDRFDPPHQFTIIYTWIKIVLSSKLLEKFLYLLILFLLTILAFKSGQRSILIFIFLIGIIIFILYYKNLNKLKKYIYHLFILQSSILFLVLFINYKEIIFEKFKYQIVANTRFETLMEGEDTSLFRRVLEAEDAISQSVKDSYLLLIIGHGFGATFKPYYSFPHPNATEEGLVHNIHIGYVMILYRYGLLGLFLICLLLYAMIKLFIFLKKIRYKNEYFVIYLFVIGFMIEFIELTLRNVFNDPINTFLIVGGIYFMYKYKYIRKKEIDNETNSS